MGLVQGSKVVDYSTLLLSDQADFTEVDTEAQSNTYQQLNMLKNL